MLDYSIPVLASASSEGHSNVSLFLVGEPGALTILAGVATLALVLVQAVLTEGDVLDVRTTTGTTIIWRTVCTFRPRPLAQVTVLTALPVVVTSTVAVFVELKFEFGSATEHFLGTLESQRVIRWETVRAFFAPITSASVFLVMILTRESITMRCSLSRQASTRSIR